MDERMRRAMLERRDRNYMRGDRGMDYRYDRTMDYDDMDYRMEDYAQRGRRNYGGRRDYGRGEYSGTVDYYGDYADYDTEDNVEPMYDGRRGVKGTGRYGIGGSRYYGRRRDRAGRDYSDYDHKDEEMRLSRRDMQDWKERLENADDTYGEHFSAAQIKQAIQAMNIQMNGYNEKELCMAANMLYSDYCEVIKPLISKDKEVLVYVNMAKAFLDDPDAAIQGGEKLACYYHYIVDDGE